PTERQSRVLIFAGVRTDGACHDGASHFAARSKIRAAPSAGGGGDTICSTANRNIPSKSPKRWLAADVVIALALRSPRVLSGVHAPCGVRLLRPPLSY